MNYFLHTGNLENLNKEIFSKNSAKWQAGFSMKNTPI